MASKMIAKNQSRAEKLFRVGITVLGMPMLPIVCAFDLAGEWVNRREIEADDKETEALLAAEKSPAAIRAKEAARVRGEQLDRDILAFHKMVHGQSAEL
jgi:hypothetical protein